MLISLVMTRGEAKTYTIEFKPPEEQSDPLLDGIFPDSEWLAELPFNTDLLKFFISDRPLDDAQGVIKLPPIPFAKSTKNKTRFEMQNDRGRRLLSSKGYPITQIFLYNAAIDVSIIDEQKPIYLGVSTATPLVIVDGPEAFGIDEDDSDIGEDDGDDDPDENEDVVVIDDLTNQELATRYLRFFLQHHVKFFKGSKLTSNQLRAAIEANAPTNVHIDLLAGRALTNAFTDHFGTGMEKRGTRIDGDVKRFWKDFHVHIHRPDPLERSWYDPAIPPNLQQ